MTTRNGNTPDQPAQQPAPILLQELSDGSQVFGLLDNGQPFTVEARAAGGGVVYADDGGGLALTYHGQAVELNAAEYDAYRAFVAGPLVPLALLVGQIWAGIPAGSPDDMRAAAVGQIAAARAILRQRRDTRHIPDTATIEQRDQESAAQFAAEQAAAARVERWPSVGVEPWICDDRQDPQRYGQHVGDDFNAGGVALSFSVPGAFSADRVWATETAFDGRSFELSRLLALLPGLLALLADPRVLALLARDDWSVPPVLLPVLALVRQQQTAGDQPDAAGA